MLHSLLVLGIWAAPALGAPAPTASRPVLVARTATVPDTIYANPEVMPQFTGGQKALVAYLQKNMRYPEKAQRRHAEGVVYVNFILNETGKIINAQVVRGPGYGLNEEALRLVWLMPAWTPGRVKGEPVRVSLTMPIAFAN